MTEFSTEKRALFIGGFGCGQNNVDQVARALADVADYAEVTGLRLPEAMAQIDTVAGIMAHREVYSHSAGMA